MRAFLFCTAGYSSVQAILRWFLPLWQQGIPNVLNGLSHPQKSNNVYLRDCFLSNMAMAYNVSQDLWGGAYAEHPLV